MKKTTVEGMDEILGKDFPVLDKGFIRVIDYMGDSTSIAEAARVSYGKGTRKVSQDNALINYLLKHAHTSPFEMCEIKFHIKLPMFVARQWIRHRTANVNEYSARYSVLTEEFYCPEKHNVAAQSTLNAQGRTAESDSLNNSQIIQFIESLEKDKEQCYANYSSYLEKNIARELARITLPISCYTQWYWKIDLNNLMHFIKLRLAPEAQYEIREYAKVMLEIMKIWVPAVYEAFINYKFESVNFSKQEFAIVKKILKGEKITKKTSPMTKRDWREFEEKIEIEFPNE